MCLHLYTKDLNRPYGNNEKNDNEPDIHFQHKRQVAEIEVILRQLFLRYRASIYAWG